MAHQAKDTIVKHANIEKQNTFTAWGGPGAGVGKFPTIPPSH